MYRITKLPPGGGDVGSENEDGETARPIRGATPRDPQDGGRGRRRGCGGCARGTVRQQRPDRGWHQPEGPDRLERGRNRSADLRDLVSLDHRTDLGRAGPGTFRGRRHLRHLRDDGCGGRRRARRHALVPCLLGRHGPHAGWRFSQLLSYGARSPPSVGHVVRQLWRHRARAGTLCEARLVLRRSCPSGSQSDPFQETDPIPGRIQGAQDPHARRVDRGMLHGHRRAHGHPGRAPTFIRRWRRARSMPPTSSGQRSTTVSGSPTSAITSSWGHPRRPACISRSISWRSRSIFRSGTGCRII